ncbi:hypothetical protein Tco_1525833 [Tanacetum coccineum]
MHFLLSSMSVVYVLTTHILEDGGNDATVEQIRKGLNGTMMTMSAEDSLEAKYMVEDDQIRSSLFTQHNMNMDKAIQVSCIIDKLPPSWKDFKHTLKHLKEELTLVELGSHLRIEESLRMQDSDKPKGNNVAGPLVFNIVEHNNFSRKLGHLKKDCKGGKVGNKANGSGINGLVDGSTNSLKGAIVHACKDRCWFKTYKSLNDGYILYIGNESTALVHRLGCVDLKFSSGKIVSLFNVLYVPNIRKNLVSSSVLNNYGYKQHARLGYVRFKRMQDMSKDRLIPAFDMDTERFVRLPDPKLKTLGKRGIECIFVGYVEHSKAFRFYVIEPNDSVLINSIIESNDAIFDENRFSSVPRLSLRILNGAEDIGDLVVPEEVTEEVVQQPEPELRKSKRNRTPNDFRPEF